MPIYEYRCQDCGNDFEYMQRMSEDPRSICETCGGSLERLISRSSFHLKGGGWYKDLYSSPKAKADSPSSDSGGDSSGSKSSGGAGSDSAGSDSSGSSGSPAGGKSEASSAVSSAAT